MAKMIRHDFNAIHTALNKMIIGEVKAALRLLPEKRIEAERETPLCRIVISPDCDYSPRDFSVMSIGLDEETGLLHITGKEKPSPDSPHYYDANFDIEETEYDEDDDLLDITDFQYLIEQIKDEVEGDKTYNLCNMATAHALNVEKVLVLPEFELERLLRSPLEY